ATRQDDTELLARINKALGKLKSDGTIDGILKKWNLAE
ncbi:MAG TPA: transporter substrate-binding domain-containing protein, partial [Bordetella sp.]|nr:transporter substrate-binding domain-containing protein [Bordetella sp.]